MQAVGEGGDENGGFDPLVALIETDGEIALEVLEGLFDCDELDIVLPEQGRIVVGEIGAQQVASLSTAYGPQLLAIERRGELATYSRTMRCLPV